MKDKKQIKKLRLTKTTIASLNSNDMDKIEGGKGSTTCIWGIMIMYTRNRGLCKKQLSSSKLSEGLIPYFFLSLR